MSNTHGTPIDDGPGVDTSIPGDPFAEFLSENDIGWQTARSPRTPDELELFASEDVTVQAAAAERSRSFVWLLVSAATVVIAISAWGLAGPMTRSSVLPADERVVLPAATPAYHSPLPSAPVLPHDAAAAVPVIERKSTSSRVRAGKRDNNRAAALSHVARPTAATAVSVNRRSSDSDVRALSVVVPIERASLLLASAPTGPRANPAIPTSLAPAHVRVTATASDPDNDGLMYRWSASIGSFADASERETVYTCPDTATTVAVTITVSDGHGGVASDTLTIHCVDRP